MPGLTSAQNGKKGGRPIGSKAESTLKIEEGRAHLAKRVIEKIDFIVDNLLEKARTPHPEIPGVYIIDVPANKELLDRAFGRAAQAVDITSKGEAVASVTPEALALAKEYENKIKKAL